LEGGALGTGQRDVGGDDFVASYFKTDPITGKILTLWKLAEKDINPVRKSSTHTVLLELD
jgi:hypothetical protein